MPLAPQVWGRAMSIGVHLIKQATIGLLGVGWLQTSGSDTSSLPQFLSTHLRWTARILPVTPLIHKLKISNSNALQTGSLGVMWLLRLLLMGAIPIHLMS